MSVPASNKFYDDDMMSERNIMPKREVNAKVFGNGGLLVLFQIFTLHLIFKCVKEKQ